jgi:hypothetical protein
MLSNCSTGPETNRSQAWRPVIILEQQAKRMLGVRRLSRLALPCIRSPQFTAKAVEPLTPSGRINSTLAARSQFVPLLKALR